MCVILVQSMIFCSGLMRNGEPLKEVAAIAGNHPVVPAARPERLPTPAFHNPPHSESQDIRLVLLLNLEDVSCALSAGITYHSAELVCASRHTKVTHTRTH